MEMKILESKDDRNYLVYVFGILLTFIAVSLYRGIVGKYLILFILVVIIIGFLLVAMLYSTYKKKIGVNQIYRKYIFNIKIPEQTPFKKRFQMSIITILLPSLISGIISSILYYFDDIKQLINVEKEIKLK